VVGGAPAVKYNVLELRGAGDGCIEPFAIDEFEPPVKDGDLVIDAGALEAMAGTAIAVDEVPVSGVLSDLHLFVCTFVFNGQGERGDLSDDEFEIDLELVLTLLDEFAANELLANLVWTFLA